MKSNTSSDELKPGREMDDLIHTKVMGRKICKVTLRHRKPYGRLSGTMLTLPTEEEIVEVDQMSPKYSTDISAAWEVVEKMGTRRLGYSLNLTNVAGTTSNPLWDADFYKLRASKSNECEATSAPHAICLAALKAMFNEV